ncbi:bacterial extracellular solute-binding protein, family 3 [Rhodoferax antarcticus ANT.BR]|uniref:Bacterial extracellular solute-binding protein, family 3 n=1 Tax=Rhodoferax antarcticus ANT.BR TaxID=1111071 RepID=A0A1Q8Y9P2_9BURK|nr:bacterial extracellular solute-binding protein, family 3 [Rhodoferax antarcticus ANT.BR]
MSDPINNQIHTTVKRIDLFLLGLVGLFLSLPALAQTSAPPSSIAAANRLQRVLVVQSLRVCIWPDYYSITYRNPKTLQLSGIDIEMAQALGKDLGVAVQFVDSSFAKLIDDVTQDRCDVAMFAVGITPERQKRLRFTQPHLVSDIFAITSRTNRRIRQWSDIDQPGSVVAVAQGTLHEPVMKARLKNAQLMVSNTPFAREQEVRSGRADVFMTDYPYSQRFLANADWARLVAPDGVYHTTPYAYAVAPGDDAWLARLDKFVSDVKRDGRLLAGAQRYRLEPIVAR